jgi:hypothetical protein
MEPAPGERSGTCFGASSSTPDEEFDSQYNKQNGEPFPKNNVGHVLCPDASKPASDSEPNRYENG